MRFLRDFDLRNLDRVRAQARPGYRRPGHRPWAAILLASAILAPSWAASAAIAGPGAPPPEPSTVPRVDAARLCSEGKAAFYRRLAPSPDQPTDNQRAY